MSNALRPGEFGVKDFDFKVSGWCLPKHKHKCVQVAIKPEGVALRDSKDPTKSTLFFDHDEWKAFTQGVKAGDFDSKQ
jgi:hypothetical protein